MKEFVTSWYSPCLNREMHIKVYGHYGVPFIFFQPQDGDCYSYDSSNFMSSISGYIEQGLIKVYSIDSADKDSFSFLNGDKSHRSYIQEQFYYYVINEVLPFIKSDCQNDNIMPYLFGVSAGANQAAIFMFRRPDLFSGCLSLSSVLDMKNYFFEGWMDERLYNNSPVDFLKNLNPNHHYVDMYNHRKIILCIGQGPWEEGVGTLRHLENICKEKGINAWFDYWGYDVAHDWPWWEKQFHYFLPHLIND